MRTSPQPRKPGFDHKLELRPGQHLNHTENVLSLLHKLPRMEVDRRALEVDISFWGVSTCPLPLARGCSDKPTDCNWRPQVPKKPLETGSSKDAANCWRVSAPNMPQIPPPHPTPPHPSPDVDPMWTQRDKKPCLWVRATSVWPGSAKSWT